MHSRPAGARPAVTELASTAPAATFTFEVGGTAPQPYTVAKPAPGGPTIVTVPVTATAVSGVARTSIVWPIPCTGDHPPIALRVSNTRVGAVGV